MMADEQPSVQRDLTYRNAISVLLADALSFRFALLEGVLVLELGPHRCWLIRLISRAGRVGRGDQGDGRR